MSGPQQQRLAHSLTGADAGQILAAADEWSRAASLLTIVAQQLEVQQNTPQSAIGGQTGKAVSGAFGRSAAAMNAKSKELMRGGGALQNAGMAIQSAETTHQGLGPQGPPPYQPNFGPGPRTPAEDRAMIDSRNRKTAYDAEYDRREREAKLAADHMDEVFADSSATLREIHGEKQTEPGGPSGGGSSSTGGAGSGGGGGATGGGGGGGTHAGGRAPHGGGGGHVGAEILVPWHLTPGHGGTHETVPTGTAATSWPTGGTLGTSQGADSLPAATLGAPNGTSAVGGLVPSQSTVSSAGTGAAIGGLAVGAGGGLLGAGGGSSSAAVRGAAPVGGAAGSNRSIGASAARGGAATLGRSTTIAGAAGSPATGSRSGAASSARTTGAGAGARSGSTRSGAPGSRQAMGNGGGGAGGGKGGGRRKKGGRTVPSDYVEEWELDDEETGPQLID